MSSVINITDKLPRSDRLVNTMVPGEELSQTSQEYRERIGKLKKNIKNQYCIKIENGEYINYQQAIYSAINSTNLYSNIEKEGDSMENDKMLEMYIQKVNQDQHDLKQDIRASEERIARNIEQMTNDFEKRMDRLEDLIVRQNDVFAQQIKEQNEKIENQNKKFDNAVESIKNDAKAAKQYNLGILISIVAILVSFIIGIAQIVTSIKLSDTTNQTSISTPAVSQDGSNGDKIVE